MPTPHRYSIILAALLVLASAPAATAQNASRLPRPAPAAPPSHARPEHRLSLPELAAKGNGEAQYQLGMAALSGKGRQKNLAEALTWLTLAASNGHAPAAAEAARLYAQHGNATAAGRWLYRAGELGDLAARGRFVDLYLAGSLANIGGSAGAGWLAERAESGDNRVRMALGDIFQRGRGVAVDLRQAERWFLGAALDGDVDAMVRLGQLQLGLPAAWRAPAAETARDGKWQGSITYALRPVARGGDGVLDLGRAGIAAENKIDETAFTFVRPGMVEGERWLKRAGRRGNAEAAYVLGRAYVEGVDLPLDLAAGIGWLQAAASADHSAALAMLADLEAKGQGFAAKDSVRAWVDYDRAAGLGAKGADSARDRLGKSMNARQIARARQVAQECRDLQGR